MAGKILSAEELVAGLRRNRGRLPTKGSEAMRKKRKKKEMKNDVLKGARFE